jgi:hypothetical protein
MIAVSADLCLISAYTGCRVNEALALTADRVEYAHGGDMRSHDSTQCAITRDKPDTDLTAMIDSPPSTASGSRYAHSAAHTDQASNSAAAMGLAS